MIEVYYLSSEMVGRGHPDKMCDQIADAILDEYLKKDKNARVALEVTGGKRTVFIAGEVTSRKKVNVRKITRETLAKAGYPKAELTSIILNISEQSPDIAMGINKNDKLAAGDQGIMFGYATNELENYMSFEYEIARKLAMFLDGPFIEQDDTFGTDFKTQITIARSIKTNAPLFISKILVSIQHSKWINHRQVQYLMESQIRKFMSQSDEFNYLMDVKTEIIVNPTGRFVKGWFDADAGTTGRKIIADTYGGAARHGGGAFSGKDYTKVDRSAAYYARYIAKNIVAADFADKCEIQLGYGIGSLNPFNVYIETFGSNHIPIELIYEIILKKVDFSVDTIIKKLNLKKVKYSDYTVYGHFGREGAAWEKLDLAAGFILAYRELSDKNE